MHRLRLLTAFSLGPFLPDSGHLIFFRENFSSEVFTLRNLAMIGPLFHHASTRGLASEKSMSLNLSIGFFSLCIPKTPYYISNRFVSMLEELLRTALAGMPLRASL